VLSFDQGLQKPDPALFEHALAELGTQAHETLMVGDRAGPDGSAVEQGITTLLLPPLERPEQRRLRHVLTLVGQASNIAPAPPPAPCAASSSPSPADSPAPPDGSCCTCPSWPWQQGFEQPLFLQSHEGPAA